jgi:hypothetical protein
VNQAELRLRHGERILGESLEVVVGVTTTSPVAV